MGTGDRGHPGPSWANMGAFYWFIKLLTPHHPVHRKRSIADEWRDHVNEEDGAQDKRRGWGESCGGRKMSKGELWVNLVGWDGHSGKIKHIFL